jgi:hypothetical protein
MDETFILNRQGGITKHFDLRLASFRMLVVYADHIETPLARRWEAPQVFSDHSCYLLPLMPVHGGFSGLHIARASRLNLDKAKDVFLPTDQINFSPAARRPEVSRYHGVAELPEMEVSRLFAAPTGEVMGSNLLRRQGVLRQPVQNPKDCPRWLPRESPSKRHKKTSNPTLPARASGGM